MRLAIETVNLNYSFGSQKVVKDLNLQVPKGSIYGFLGPNGAGKTTTIKILLNLLKSGPDSVFLFGKEINANRVECLKQIGSLVEQPAIYGHLSGRDNLTNRALLLNIKSKRVDEMLELVGLTKAATKKAKNYSLGMKQRLGIALALLADPELLLLDEPTNGLDPNGIIEIRNLMKDLVTNHNKTILVSSHLLAEIEKVATNVGIINNGELLFQGTITELQDLSKPWINLECSDIEKASNIAQRAGFTVQDVKGSTLALNFSDREQLGKLNTELVTNGITVYRLSTEKKDLEHLFLDITSKN